MILGIESSCDETAAAIYDGERMRSNVVATQAVHAAFGGVVPELASRAHDAAIWPTVDQALKEAGITLDDLRGIAVTQGPGLMGALLVGLGFAKGLALSRNLPLVGVNHLEAHVYAAAIEHKLTFPFLALVVSGGHTRLELVKDWFDHELLGQTRDDAAGEAFDKIGKMMGLPYPAGRQMDELARRGNILAHKFPMGLLDQPFEFSFSGLKTSALYYLKSLEDKGEWPLSDGMLADMSASVSEAITEVLRRKTAHALEYTGAKALVVAGGVSANSMLRRKMQELCAARGVQLMIPSPQYCTDNAAMIAITGWHKHRLGYTDDLNLRAFAAMPG